MFAESSRCSGRCGSAEVSDEGRRRLQALSEVRGDEARTRVRGKPSSVRRPGVVVSWVHERRPEAVASCEEGCGGGHRTRTRKHESVRRRLSSAAAEPRGSPWPCAAERTDGGCSLSALDQNRSIEETAARRQAMRVLDFIGPRGVDALRWAARDNAVPRASVPSPADVELLAVWRLATLDGVVLTATPWGAFVASVSLEDSTRVDDVGRWHG